MYKKLKIPLKHLIFQEKYGILIMLILLPVGRRYISGSNLIGRTENTVNKTNNQTAQEQIFSNELMGILNEEERKTDKNNN